MQRYFVQDKKDNQLFLEMDDVHHIRNVMRNKVGDFIECVYQGQLYICEIMDLFSNQVRIVEDVIEENEDALELTVAIALVKEQKMDLILQKLTELGVSRIIPLKMERSIVQLDEKRFNKKKERWIKICKEAAEQSKRNKIPEITDLYTLRQLKELSFDKKFICSTKNSENLICNYLQDKDGCATMIFVVGPEGGIASHEEELLESFGYLPISLGKRIMRVETAAIYIASVVNFCNMG